MSGSHTFSLTATAKIGPDTNYCKFVLVTARFNADWLLDNNTRSDWLSETSEVKAQKSSRGCFRVVQAFYREKSVNLTLIAKEGFLTDFGPGTCPL